MSDDEQHPSMLQRRDRYTVPDQSFEKKATSMDLNSDKHYDRMETAAASSLSDDDEMPSLSPPPRTSLCRVEGAPHSMSAFSLISYTQSPSQHYDDNDTASTMATAATSTTLQPLQEILRDKKASRPCLFAANKEVGVLGSVWRTVLRHLVVWCIDDINALRLSRSLQLFLPFLTCYESFLLGQVIKVMAENNVHNSKRTLSRVLAVAFQNRNVSRILVQQLRPRFDWLWHWCFRLRHNRGMDAWGQFPIVGISRFPTTENFPNTRDHALASIFRVILGEGWWISRTVTKREGLITDNQLAVAQNLAAESNGFELANRNQYGTYVGRRKTNEFRFSLSLPTDESIVRTFVRTPMPTLLNNGVVHVLRQLAKHWKNTLAQQNFAHQKMEQLDPFETLRFHLVEVLITLSSLRGRNVWDSRTLAPVVKRLQRLSPARTTEEAQELVAMLKRDIAVPVCGGVASISDPFIDWLDCIGQACIMLEQDMPKVQTLVESVDLGIKLGHELMTHVDWKIPNSSQLKRAIVAYILENDIPFERDIPKGRIRSALNLITPRDKRTLIELIKNGYYRTKPCQLLLGRAKTLLQRELRRELLDRAIQDLSKRQPVRSPSILVEGESYWMEQDGREGVYMYQGMLGREHKFLHLNTDFEKLVSFSNVKIHLYVPVAQAITRAQKAFMEIELDFGKRFAYNAFMEFKHLRCALRRLIVISQINCEELDTARLNYLRDIQRMQLSSKDLLPGDTYYRYEENKKEFVPFVLRENYSAKEWAKLSQQQIVKAPPQSMIVIGGGPAGLVTTIHCTEAVLASGGIMKLYEARDSFAKGGASFERAQIVRLDARWIAMLRYHLGTGFEDVFIPASGETDSQLGNTLPESAFVEITIKDLENMLHVEVSKMWSKGLLQLHTDSRFSYDPKSNSLTKLGEHLKKEDAMLLFKDENGSDSFDPVPWKVAELKYKKSLGIDEIKVGNEYGIYVRVKNAVLPFELSSIDPDKQTYTFKSLDTSKPDLVVNAADLPSVYPKGTQRHAEVTEVVFQCMKIGRSGRYLRETFSVEEIKGKRFTMDVGQTHVVEAIGKPHGSQAHFQVTTCEPYGVCCLQGVKVSMGMHNFGERRWQTGIIDDIRSLADQNTRIIGDFTKMIRVVPIAEKMYEYMTDTKDRNWQIHFDMLVENSSFPGLNEIDPVVPKIQLACAEFANDAKGFRRNTLQTRFFETGDNFYLGMEFTREYDRWKNQLGCELIAPIARSESAPSRKAELGQLKRKLMHHIDRLWYDGVLEVIRKGDVYNSGARHRVPRLYLINSYTDVRVGSFPVGESFRLSEDPDEMYEIMVKTPTSVIVRNVEGYISKMPRSTLARREGNLTRSPDGNNESRVALSTFPVAHFVNHRTLRLNNLEKSYVFAFIGDEQATPHFMRYSGLTGACINAMLFNNFIKQANNGIPFIERYREYAIDTNWSNGEVVQRGTGNNYGDGFLRPGFSYDCVLDYLHSKVIENQESGQEVDSVLSRDWKTKLAASLVPRGMAFNKKFIDALFVQLQQHVFNKMVRETAEDWRIGGDALEHALKTRQMDIQDQREAYDNESYWNSFLSGLAVDEQTITMLEETHITIAKRLDQICGQIVEHAKMMHLYNERISSELFNQPKPVDSILDDFAVEAQNFANSLTQSAAFSSGTLAFRLMDESISNIFSATLAGLNIGISFGTMTNVARYKIRNEEARVIFADEKMLGVMKGVFAAMDREAQDSIPIEQNPFVISLEQQVSAFLKNVDYFDYEEPLEFAAAYSNLKRNINDPEEISIFMDLIATRFIVDTYHVNSYIQENLVHIYKTLDDMHRLLTQDVNRATGCDEAWILFHRLTYFRGDLESTLQRGPTRWGFIKRRPLSQWDCTVVFKYFYSLVCCSTRSCVLPTAPISAETLSIIKQARYLSELHDSQILRREIRDLEGLYWATRESDIASLIFMSTFLVFISSIVFTIARIFHIPVLENIAFWATLASGIGAILAMFHLWRKFVILVKLIFTLGLKEKNAKSGADRDNVKKVRHVTLTQILLTLMRLFAAASAAVALPWSVAVNGFGPQLKMDGSIPFWIALGSVCAAVASTLLFFIVEFVVRYNLSPKLGEFVCESFRKEIEGTYEVLSIPGNDIDTKQVQERETWEYVAREFLHRYRFDAVFAADRFGSILQYLQGGMDPRDSVAF